MAHQTQKDYVTHYKGLWAWKVRAGKITQAAVNKAAAQWAYGPGGIGRICGTKAGRYNPVPHYEQQTILWPKHLRGFGRRSRPWHQ